ncbi:hypothetical protein GCM10010271_26400 [Streptomyces kurssanovii]|nr:hypothetical protein GCM10010271_26400 [Streptomyces kurssanovii]
MGSGGFPGCGHPDAAPADAEGPFAYRSVPPGNGARQDQKKVLKRVESVRRGSA